MPRPELYPVKKVVGFDERMIDAIEKWRRGQKLIPNMSEAIRRLVELGLLAEGPGEMKTRQPESRAKRAAKAADMAGRQIDQLGDKSAPDEVRAQRKRRLIKGPPEFREMRADHRSRRSDKC